MPAPLRNATYPVPAFRPLRVYAFDPSLATQLETAVLNQTTLKVIWESEPRTGISILKPGPVGEYLEVVDYDPASQCFYAPVDLDDPSLLAQGGLPPSEGNPKFHQQMVYAVSMTTIRHFERALGRLALWSPRRAEDGDGKIHFEYVPRLRIYPHALREANAYYSPDKKALLFGYFPASADHPDLNLPGGLVFTCLSHDVVAHETTHALLDGLHRRFNEASNPDVLAFHEGFADVVALFQHFNNQDVLLHQVARTRGDLASQNMLGQLAQQFGQAIGGYGALRDAIGYVDDKGDWHRQKPNPTAYQTTTEPHARGSLLVAAVFDAFLSIYKARVADLLRIATKGTGVLPAGDIHPDLARRLASEAAKAAGHVLVMCIRALDYCPPVDLTFGEYLRALITADADLVPDDDLGYRVAFIEAFRYRGIYPRDVRTLSVESLRWQAEIPGLTDKQRAALLVELRKIKLDWNLTTNRESVYHSAELNRLAVHEWLVSHDLDRAFTRALGLALHDDAPATIARHPKTKRPLVEVHSVRPARRVGPDGQLLVDLIVEITQRRLAFLDPKEQDRHDKAKTPIDVNAFAERRPEETFVFRGGCTLVVSMESAGVRACIRKDILSSSRLERQRRFFRDPTERSLHATYFGDFRTGDDKEPFAMLHRDF